MKKRKRLDAFEVVNYIFLTLLIIIIVYPFVYVVVNSFNALSSHRPSFFLAGAANAPDISDGIP